MSKSATAHAVGLVGAVVAANVVTMHVGQVHTLGMDVTAGTLFAGAVFILRDHLQRAAGKPVTIAVVLVAAGLSALLAGPQLALASGAAFLVSELLDMGVWTRLEDRGYITAAGASNTVGSIVDTFLFLWLSGFGITLSATAGQLVGKLGVTGLVLLAVVVYRRTRATDLDGDVELELVPVPAYGTRARVTAPLQHLCPFRNEVDHGTVTMEWDVDGCTVELHSLRAWLQVWASITVSHEQLTAELYDHLADSLGLAGVAVSTSWDTAGMAVVVTA